MTQDIYELIFRGLQAKYPGQPIGPHFQAQVDIGERKDGKRLYYLNEIKS